MPHDRKVSGQWTESGAMVSPRTELITVHSPHRLGLLGEYPQQPCLGLVIALARGMGHVCFVGDGLVRGRNAVECRIY